MLSTPVHVLVGAVLPYLAVAVFLAGVTWRLLTWKRMPQPAPLTLFPTRGSGIGPLLKEAFLFSNLRRGDGSLWSLAWVFHLTLAIAFIGHLRIVSALGDRALGGLGISPGAIAAISTLAGGAAGVVLLLAIAGFIGRRLLLRRVREISSVPDYLGLLLLTAVITSGNLMRWLGSPTELALARSWFASLLTLSPQVPHSPLLLLHAFFAELLILYIAFSKLMHFGGFFFTFSLTKRTCP